MGHRRALSVFVGPVVVAAGGVGRRIPGPRGVFFDLMLHVVLSHRFFQSERVFNQVDQLIDRQQFLQILWHQ